MATIWSSKPKKPAEQDYFSATLYSSVRLAAELDEIKALQVPTVKAAVELITSSIAQLPIYLYAEDTERAINRIHDDKRESLLNHEPNRYDSGQVIKKKIVQDYLLRGKAYLYQKNGELHYLEAKNINERTHSLDGFTAVKKEFEYKGKMTVIFNEKEILVIDSGTNGLLVDSGKLLNTAYEQLNYHQAFLTNGAMPNAVLKAASRLTEKAIERLRNGFENLYSGTKKAGNTLILEEGLDYQAVSGRPDEFGLYEGSRLSTSEIARVFNIPESMLNSAANKYASLEQNNIQFLQNCISPIVTAIESAFDKYLLNSTEKQTGHFFRFDTSELLRTTEEQKVKTTVEALRGSLISFNEARAKLDMKPEKKDFYMLSLGHVLKDAETGELTVFNTGEQINGGGSSSENGIKK